MSKFVHSKLLFKAEDGSAIEFYMPPCEERQKLRPLIEHGGGTISNKNIEKGIRLLAEGLEAKSDGMVKTSYVYDCVKQNRLLDQKAYIMNEGEMVVTDEDLDIGGDIFINMTANAKKGRSRYTYREEKAMLNYLLESDGYLDVGGNTVWRKMEQRKITNHPWQSMRDHFHKYMLPKINTFGLAPNQVFRFTNDAKSLTPQKFSACSTKNSTPKKVTTPTSTKLLRMNATAMSNSSPQVNDREYSSPTKKRKVQPLHFLESSSDEEIDDFDKELLSQAAPTPKKSPTKSSAQCSSPLINKYFTNVKNKSPFVEKVNGNISNVTQTPKNKQASQLTSSGHSSQSAKKNSKKYNQDVDVFEYDCNNDSPNIDSGPKRCKMTSPFSSPKTKKANAKISPLNRSIDRANSSAANHDSYDALKKARRKVFDDSDNQKLKESRNTDHRKNKKATQSLPNQHALLDFFGQTQGESSSDSSGLLTQRLAHHLTMLESVSQWLGVEKEEVFDVWYATSGVLKHAVHLILYGANDGLSEWTSSDDNKLNGGTESEIADLEERFGVEEVRKRQLFLASFEI